MANMGTIEFLDNGQPFAWMLTPDAAAASLKWASNHAFSRDEIERVLQDAYLIALREEHWQDETRSMLRVAELDMVRACNGILDARYRRTGSYQPEVR